MPTTGNKVRIRIDGIKVDGELGSELDIEKGVISIECYPDNMDKVLELKDNPRCTIELISEDGNNVYNTKSAAYKDCSIYAPYNDVLKLKLFFEIKENSHGQINPWLYF